VARDLDFLRDKLLELAGLHGQQALTQRFSNLVVDEVLQSGWLCQALLSFLFFSPPLTGIDRICRNPPQPPCAPPRNGRLLGVQRTLPFYSFESL